MKKGMLEYKGYYTKIIYDNDSEILHGKIENIDDLVTFESEDSREIIQEFHSAVDDYLLFCKAIGKAPETSLGKVINITLDPKTYRRLMDVSNEINKTPNFLIEQAVCKFLNTKF